MPCKLNAKLLDENLKIIDNIKVKFEPKNQSVTFYDSKLANTMFRIESTNIVYINKNLNLDISKYIYLNKKLYKIIKLDSYDSYSECLVYECNNIDTSDIEDSTIVYKEYIAPPKRTIEDVLREYNENTNLMLLKEAKPNELDIINMTKEEYKEYLMNYENTISYDIELG